MYSSYAHNNNIPHHTEVPLELAIHVLGTGMAKKWHRHGRDRAN